VTIRTRADAFERVLTGEGPALDDELRRLLATVAEVRALAPAGAAANALAPRAEFRAALRERLVLEAGALSAARVPAQRRPGEQVADEPPPGRRVRRARRVLAGALAICLAGGAGAAVASSSALPGQPLYPVKRGVEHVRLSLAGSDAGRGLTQLDLARTRLDEAEMLLVAGSGGGADGEHQAERERQAQQALGDFSLDARAGVELLMRSYAEGGDRKDLAAADEFLHDAVPRLSRIRIIAPAAVDRLVDSALSDLVGLRARLAVAVADCGADCADLDAAGPLGTLLPQAGAVRGGQDRGPVGAPGGSPSAVDAVPGEAPAAGEGPVAGPRPSPPRSAAGAPPAPLPFVASPTGSVTVSVGDVVGAEVHGGGVSASLPGAGLRVPAPSTSSGRLHVPLPEVTVGTATVSAPGVLVDPGGIGAPGCSVTVLGICVP
jgi:hypothetical protein